jgi:hypothetical protein
MGAVYKARQPTLDRIVALKILPKRDDPAFAERFTREARALAKLSHPGIVTVHDFGQAGDLYYFVMEYVEGVNLRQAERGKLSPAEALAIVPQICAALQFAHDAGVVHRDIKPENILLDAKGRVKIADFGLAKLSGAAGPNPLTHTHQVMGTVHYMAPEQWEKPAEVDHRADIYSLGVVFYELLTGELPLGRFPLPSERVQIDVRLDDIVLRTLEKQPDRRYQHASEVKTDVEKVATPTRTPTHSVLLLDRFDFVRRLLQNGLLFIAAAFLGMGLNYIWLSMNNATPMIQVLPGRYIGYGEFDLGLMVFAIILASFIKQRWETTYRGHRIQFINGIWSPKRLYVDGQLVAGGGFGRHAKVEGRLHSGEGAGDRLIANIEAGALHLRMRLFAESTDPPAQALPSTSAQPSSQHGSTVNPSVEKRAAPVASVPAAMPARPKRSIGSILAIAITLMMLLGCAGIISLMFFPVVDVLVDVKSNREQIVGKWLWVGREGWTEFRADGTFEEKWREEVMGTSDGAPDPDKPKVWKDFHITGQYRWISDDRMETKSPGRPDNQFRVVVKDDELAVLIDDGSVRRMQKLSTNPAGAKSETQQKLFGSWKSTVGDLRYEFTPEGTFTHWARIKPDPHQSHVVEKRVTGRYRWQDEQLIEFRAAEGSEGEIIELHFDSEKSTWSVKGPRPRIKFVREHDGFVMLKEHGEVGARIKPEHAKARSTKLLPEAIVGIWAWTEPMKYGWTTQFFADGTFTTIDDVGNSIGLGAPEFLGQYRWLDTDRIEMIVKDKPKRIVTVRISENGNTLTLLERDGDVQRMERGGW